MVPNFVFRPAAATGSGHCPAKTLAASIYGGQRSSIEPAAASGCRHGRPAAATGSGHCPAKTLAASIYGGQRSSIECAAASGCRHGRPAAATGSGHCPAKTLAASIYGGQRSSPECAAAGCGAVTPSFPTAKHPEALIYGRRMRLAGASSCVQAQPARR